MTLATAIALLAALDGAAEVLLRIIEDLKASGHPVDASLPPDIEAKIRAAVTSHVNSLLSASPGNFMESRSQGAEV